MSPDEEERRAVQSLSAQKDARHGQHENEYRNPSESDVILIPMPTDYDIDDKVGDDSHAVLDIYRQKNKPIRPPNPHTLISQRYEITFPFISPSTLISY